MSKTTNDLKFKEKYKAEDKFLVYAMISTNCISKPNITPSSFAINGDNYTVNCLAKNCLHNFRNLPENTRYIFWPDLAILKGPKYPIFPKI